jgi:hypothetical protein
MTFDPRPANQRPGYKATEIEVNLMQMTHYGIDELRAAIGLALVENGWRVPFTRTTDLV